MEPKEYRNIVFDDGPPPSGMTNRQIRAVARRQWPRRYLLLVVAGLLSFGPGLLFSFLPMEALPYLAELLIRAAFSAVYTLVTMGCVAVFSSCYRTGTAFFWQLGRCFKDGALAKSALVYGALYSCVTLAFGLLVYATGFLPVTEYMAGLYSLLLVLLMLCQLYITLRLFLAPYLLLDIPGLSGVQALRQSFARTRGTVLRQVGFAFSYFGWLMIPIGAASIVLSSVMMPQMAGSILTGGTDALTLTDQVYGWLLPLTYALMSLFPGPYLQVGMAGLADELVRRSGGYGDAAQQSQQA